MFVFNQSSRSLLFQMSWKKYFHTSYKLCSFGCKPVTKFWFDEKSALLFYWTISLLLFSFISLYFCAFSDNDWEAGTRAGEWKDGGTQEQERQHLSSQLLTWDQEPGTIIGILFTRQIEHDEHVAVFSWDFVTFWHFNVLTDISCFPKLLF